MISLEVRFLKFVKKTDTCWLWTGSINQFGYGVMWYIDRAEKAHRISYLLYKGLLISGKCIDHLCRNKKCVNPAHLEQVSYVSNRRRGNNPQRDKTHCINGHEFTKTNTYIDPKGGRRCRRCRWK